MEAWELVILVDAVSKGEEPGTAYIIEPQLPRPGESPAGLGFDAHSMNPESVLELVGTLCRPDSRLPGKLRLQLLADAEGTVAGVAAGSRARPSFAAARAFSGCPAAR